MNFTELRLKIRHFLRKYKKIVLIALSIWAIVVFINYLLKNREVEPEATTTYEPHVSVMNDFYSTPKSMQEPIERMIEEYVGYCNDGNYQKAFDMLSEDCKKYEFNDDVQEFMSHVRVKMPLPKEYSIQSYSNMTISDGNIYIYEIKYFDDILATGLTNSEYHFSNEKMTFYRDDDGTIQMAVGNYIYHTDIQSISENEYLKIDIIDKVVNYSIEKYAIKFTNRSDYTIVVADGYGEGEIQLQLNNEVRNRTSTEEIVLSPGESITETFIFSKFADDGDTSQSLNFGSIRVMEMYSGTNGVETEVIEKEIENALAKFSMNVSITK